MLRAGRGAETDERAEKWVASRYDERLLGPLAAMEPTGLNLMGSNVEQSMGRSLFRMGRLGEGKRGVRRRGQHGREEELKRWLREIDAIKKLWYAGANEEEHG